MNTALVNVVTELVEHACASEKNKIGYEIWKYHIKPMVPIAQELATVHKADEEIVTLAVLLHDLAGIEDFSKRKQHHIFGAERAKEILAGYHYPSDKTELVARSILNHRADLNLPKNSPEEYCVADADMLINIVDIPSLFYDSYHQEHLCIAEGKTWRQSTLQLYWEHVSPVSQAQFLDRFTLAKRLSQGNESENYSFETDLERSLADADAVAHMFDLPSLFFVAYEKQGMEFEEGRHWVLQKIQSDWQKMSKLARARYADQYNEILNIFYS